MKLNRIFVAVLFVAATASSAFAQGAASISWNGCTGPIDLAVPGGAAVNAYASVLGQSQTASAYQVIVIAGPSSGVTRDAWRFDPAGCDVGFFTLNSSAPAAVSNVCPSFAGNVQSLQIKDYSYDATTGKVKITLANAYPNGGAGNPGAVNPSQRYFLANYNFDLSFAVAGPGDPPNTCGGVEVPMCFALSSATWLDLNGAEIPWSIAQGYITSNDPNNTSHCPGAVPTAPRTWGSVKSQYRD